MALEGSHRISREQLLSNHGLHFTGSVLHHLHHCLINCYNLHRYLYCISLLVSAQSHTFLAEVYCAFCPNSFSSPSSVCWFPEYFHIIPYRSGCYKNYCSLRKTVLLGENVKWSRCFFKSFTLERSIISCNKWSKWNIMRVHGMRNHGWGIMQPQTSKIVHYWYFTNHTETLPLPISTARTCLRQPVEFCKNGAHQTLRQFRVNVSYTWLLL